MFDAGEEKNLFEFSNFNFQAKNDDRMHTAGC